MSQALLFSWFPILLGVGVGGRLLGQARGLGLGALAALFWLALVQAQGGVGVWRDPWQVGAMAAGAFVLVMMGGWSGQSEVQEGPRNAGGAGASVDAAAFEREESIRWQKVTSAAEQFEDWLTRHVSDRNPWPKFGEFIRTVLYDCCQATRVKCFRYAESTQELHCLDESDDLVQSSRISPTDGVIGRVCTSGQSFIAGQGTANPCAPPGREAAESRRAGIPGAPGFPAAAVESNHRGPCWCFAIECRGGRLGVVAVGQLGVSRPSRAHMAAVEKLIGVFWLHLIEVNSNRVAGDEDPVSGLLNRPTFLRSADAALRGCYEQGEPVALAVVGVQGLRHLNDSGRWEVADALIQEIGKGLQTRARLDDRIGRFDGSRFIWLLRRVDAELAGLILKHVMGYLEQICSSGRWGVPVAAYCGFTGSGTGKPDLRRLVTSALQQAQRARIEGVPLASDLAFESTSPRAGTAALVGAEA